MDEISESDFDQVADRTLSRLVESLANTEDTAFDADLESGVLTVEFNDGSRYVINSHRAARQIWMAADASAWHFNWNGSQWISTKSEDELWSLVEQRIGAKVGHTVDLRSADTATP